MRRRTVTTALTAALTASAASALAAPALAEDGTHPADGTGRPGRPGDRPPRLLVDGTGLYPRAIRLAHQGEADDRLLASVVSFDGPSGYGAIWESVDGGETFAQVGTVSDEATAGGEGLCCATLYELPRAVGDLPAGTLLWSASVGADQPDRRMTIRIWASTDVGRTWERIAITAVAANAGGLWEPEFALADDDTLVLWYCDETDGERHSQKIVQQTSVDGLTWTDREDTIALADPAARPGMPNVRRLSTGDWAMSYEICGPSDHCRTFVRTARDPRNWGPVTARDEIIRAIDGTEPRHTPTLLVDDDGSVLLGAQMHYGPDGETSAANGQVVLRTRSRSLKGRVRWITEPAPVPVDEPWNNYCPNYSPTFVRTATGHLLEITSAPTDEGVCRPWYGSTGR
ncbi:sialidase family protein [Brachybacterium sp. J144]|uniref:sialidase family protein n=1 Tax=Brachybacterium sp. J144 TaxID=3116487 RepID=UPI002E77D172|nr:sialidase family protein [Brachybacterium sp. J144]MEE1650329.1 sialidase family protein [Brachybacterium sp. J144]